MFHASDEFDQFDLYDRLDRFDELDADSDHHRSWWEEPEPAPESEPGRLSHLVFLDGRLVDSWSENPYRTPYACLAQELDAQRSRPVVRVPPPPPRHVQVLGWLDGIVGGRDALLALTPDAGLPQLRGVLDPVADEPWLVVDELLGDVCDSLLSPDLTAPFRRCLLLLHERAPWLPARTSVAKIAAGIVWVVGKANAAIGPAGPVTQLSIAAHLGVDSLTPCGAVVAGHVRRLPWATSPPYPHPGPVLYATGRPELLTEHLVRELVRLRDDALAEQHACLPSGVES